MSLPRSSQSCVRSAALSHAPPPHTKAPHPLIHSQAYFKMNNVLIDDRRIKVDFSQVGG